MHERLEPRFEALRAAVAGTKKGGRKEGKKGGRLRLDVLGKG